MPKTVLRPGGLWLAGAIAATLFGLAGAARAQVVVEEVTIIGHQGPRGDVQSLSRVVSFADLDLTQQADRRTLDRRIAMAARDVCERLGEPRVPLAAGDSCTRDAIERARPQLRTAYAMAVGRGAYSVVGVPAYAIVPVEPAPPPPEYVPEPPPPEASAYEAAPAASAYGQTASVTVQTVTNGPVPDTAANRQKFGGPLSNAGRQTRPVGN